MIRDGQSQAHVWGRRTLDIDLDSLRRENTRQAKINLIRRRLETGYYLSNDIAAATARKMLETTSDPPAW
jgi:7,8-dihydro-6-hydroxymethylpterin-pyrophosphokinase